MCQFLLETKSQNPQNEPSLGSIPHSHASHLCDCECLAVLSDLWFSRVQSGLVMVAAAARLPRAVCVKCPWAASISAWCRGDDSVKLRCSKEASEHLTADAGEGAAFVWVPPFWAHLLPPSPTPFHTPGQVLRRTLCPIPLGWFAVFFPFSWWLQILFFLFSWATARFW